MTDFFFALVYCFLFTTRADDSCMCTYTYTHAHVIYDAYNNEYRAQNPAEAAYYTPRRTPLPAHIIILLCVLRCLFNFRKCLNYNVHRARDS